VSPVVLSLWPRFEPFGAAMGSRRVPWFGDERSLAARKSREFPRRNAKTRWGEPAGLERNGHVAVTKCMEAASWTRNVANFQIAEINWRPADFGLRSREGEAVPLVCREMELSRVGFVTKPLSGQR
jgi:hypothetical protein